MAPRPGHWLCARPASRAHGDAIIGADCSLSTQPRRSNVPPYRWAVSQFQAFRPGGASLSRIGRFIPPAPLPRTPLYSVLLSDAGPAIHSVSPPGPSAAPGNFDVGLSRSGR